MFRISSSLHVPPIGVNFLFPFLKNPTCSNKVSSFTRLALLHSSTLLPNSGNIQFPSCKRVLTMVGGSPSCLRGISASYSVGTSPGGSSAGGREILVQHLLVREELLPGLQKRAAEGEDLSDLAVEYSMCPSSKDGGMLGWVKKGQLLPEFEEAAFSAPLNKVVKCKTDIGWHLLQVLSEREESVLEHIQPSEIHVKLQDPSFLEEAQLIDVREPDEVFKVSPHGSCQGTKIRENSYMTYGLAIAFNAGQRAQASLPGFQVLPLRQFGSWGPEITTKFDPQKDTYVLCHHGMRSLQVAKWLQTQTSMHKYSAMCTRRKLGFGLRVRDSGKYLMWPEESMNMLSKLIHRSQLIEAGILRVSALSPAQSPDDRAKFEQNHFCFQFVLQLSLKHPGNAIDVNG
ncbi:Rhodanese-like/PpiC domain-containing protein 12 [Capsicum annuum]|nr:Rhodanese-like/PpiC domain-containing protein 12 [Capsicum annuum]